MLWLRALAIWLLLMTAEVIHGTLRTLFLAPRVGDFLARQIAVGTGSLIILGIVALTRRWLRAESARSQLGVGLLWVVCQLDAKFPPFLYVKNPPLWLSQLIRAGSLQVPSGTWGVWVGGRRRGAEGGRRPPGAPASLRQYPLSSASPPWGPAGCGKRAAFSKGCGRVPGGGRGWQPSIPRQTAGRGDRGPGEEGYFPHKPCGKTATRRHARLGGFTTPPPGRIPLKPAAPQGRPGRPRPRCRARCGSAGQPCASP